MKSKNVFRFSFMASLGWVATISMATGVHAAPICGNFQECRAMEAQVEGRIIELSKIATSAMTGIVKSRVTKVEAKKICADLGMRLPTARELALVAQSYSARGISETPKEGYELVTGNDSAGGPDHFYYSNHGYTKPADDLGFYFFRSSSDEAGAEVDGSYHLTGGTGAILFLEHQYSPPLRSAVRCLP